MTPNVQLEVERKYEVPAGAEPDWSILPTLTVEAEVDNRDLEAVYFDTASDRLAGFGIALRRRKGGQDAGWHLKYRDELGKHELHVPMLKTSDRMPAQMKQYVAGLLAGQEVAPLATVANTRRVLNVNHPDHGFVAEICIDDVTATAHRTGVQRTWAEYEVELVNGSGAQGSDVFDELEVVLLAAGLTPSESTAKIARALGAEDDAPAVTVTNPDGTVIAGDQGEDGGKDTKAKGAKKSGKKKSGKKAGKSAKNADKTTAEKKDKKSEAKGDHEAGEKPQGSSGKSATSSESTEDQVWVLANHSVARLLYADFLLRIGDPEGVHAVRVAVRGLIAVMQGVGDEIAGEGYTELAERLSAVSDRLSAARDAEVVVETLPLRAIDLGDLLSGAGLGQLNALAQDNRESTRAAAVRYINGKEHLQLLSDVAGWAEGIELSKKARELSAKKVATRAVKRWTRALVDADADLETDQDSAAEAVAKSSEAVERVHVSRKALRNLRYGLDGMAVTTGLVPKKSWRGVLDGTQEIQAQLSEMMDCAVMDDWFSFASRSLIRTGGDRYVVGLLHGQERTRLQSYEQDAPELIDRLLSKVTSDT